MLKTYVEKKPTNTYEAFQWDGESSNSKWPEWFKLAISDKKVSFMTTDDGVKICYHTAAVSDNHSGNPTRRDVGDFVIKSKAFVCGFRVLPPEQFNAWYEEAISD